MAIKEKRQVQHRAQLAENSRCGDVLETRVGVHRAPVLHVRHEFGGNDFLGTFSKHEYYRIDGGFFQRTAMEPLIKDACNLHEVLHEPLLRREVVVRHDDHDRIGPRGLGLLRERCGLRRARAAAACGVAAIPSAAAATPCGASLSQHLQARRVARLSS